MCGIAGAIDFRGRDVMPLDADRAAALLTHRGPDDGGIRAYPATGDAVVCLAHRRLAVLDLSEQGRQPLENEDGTVAVVFNGEIYNFSQLRTELVRRRHHFRSTTDTEVIVHGYEEWGVEVVRRLDGMFAFALWDARRNRLLLARDRLGKKPLYFASNDDRTAFASEIKAFGAWPWVDAQVAWEHVASYLAFGYVPWPHTMVRGVSQVPPASTMIVDGDGVHPPVQYWTSPFLRDVREVGWRDAVEEVDALLADAVRKRLVSDVPLGVLLSGGVDSAAIVSALGRLGRDLHAFTAGFPDAPSFDETGAAVETARHFGLRHTCLEVRTDAADLVDTVLHHTDQPFADSSCLPTFLIAREARKHVTVVLTGDGGDEVFGGYDRFRGLLLSERMPPGLQSALGAVGRSLPPSTSYGSLASRLRRFGASARATAPVRYLSWVAVFDPTTLAELMDTTAETYSSFVHAWNEADGQPILHKAMHANLTTYLHDDLLVKVDRMTMAHGLEARSPLLDVALLESVATLPPSMKATARESKRVLRATLRGSVPPGVLHRRKHGFGVPVGEWFRGPLREPFEDLVLGADARLGCVVDVAAARSMFSDHCTGRGDHGQRLWALLALESWLRGRAVPRTSGVVPSRPD